MAFKHIIYHSRALVDGLYFSNSALQCDIGSVFLGDFYFNTPKWKMNLK